MALLITETVFKANTPLSAAVDWAIISPSIQVAQDLGLMTILGQKLYEKIETDYTDDTLTGYYLTLYNNYIVRYLCYKGMETSLPDFWAKMAKGGIFRQGTENSPSVEMNELQYLIGVNRERAQSYADRMIEYMLANLTEFPEYYTNVSGDVYPDSSRRKMRGININLY